SSYNPSKEEDLTKGHDMAWNERKYNLIKLNKHVEKWKVLRTSSFQRLVIAAALWGLGTLITSLTSLKKLFTKEEKKNNKYEEKFNDSVVSNSKKNCPKRLDSSQSSPLLFVKALIKHIN
ncbi:22798_t:CDS:2, partial [Racocetra persica]